MNTDTILIDIDANLLGSVLELNSGQSFNIDVTPSALDSALVGRNYPASATLCKLRNTDVLSNSLRMNEREWGTISRAILKADTAFDLCRIPGIRRRFKQSFSAIREVPYRVYGGLGHPCEEQAAPTLYLSHPYDFHVVGNREIPWYYCLISDQCNNLFRTYVNADTREVEVEQGVIENHFLV